MTEPGYDNPRLLLGIDLGSSRISVVSNRGYRGVIPSVLGYPRDIIAVKMLGKTQVFGEEALAHRSALVLYHPLRDGLVADGGKGDYNALAELLGHVADLATGTRDRAGDRSRIRAVIGVPARLIESDRGTLQRIADRFFANALLVSQPYLLAYRLDRLSNCLIVDIGAGAVTVCAIKGAAPSARDQAILPKAGDALDQRLQAIVSQRYPEVRFSTNQARMIKEQFGFVGLAPAPVTVSLRAKGKPRPYDLTSELGTVCAEIVPDIVERLSVLLQEFDPEDQEAALQNIYLGGGGSRIHGLAELIASSLAEYGQVRVTRVESPEYAAAEGALRLAAELPDHDWWEFGLAGRPLNIHAEPPSTRPDAR